MMSRLKEIRESKGLTQDQLAEAIGVQKNSVYRYEKDDHKLTIPLLEELAKALDCSIAEIVGESSAPEKRSPPVREVDVRAGAGAGGVELISLADSVNGMTISADAIKDEWWIPDSFLREDLKVSPGKAWILEVTGDSGYDPNNAYAPGSIMPGDRIIVDTSDIKPSPPGAFVVHDGAALVVKWVEIVVRSDPPMIRLTSRNPQYSPYEVSLEDEARIIGRVRGRITAM